jgi:hypothetical protein
MKREQKGRANMNWYGILENPLINTKFQEELRKSDLFRSSPNGECELARSIEILMNDIDQMSRITREYGILALREYQTSNPFLKEILRFISVLGSADVSKLYDIGYYFAPRLLTDCLSGWDYISAVLYIEILNQLFTGEPSIFVKCRIHNILGSPVTLAELIQEEQGS